MLISCRLGLCVFVPVLAASALYLLGDVETWLGVWAYTSTQLNMSLLFGLSAASGGAAWIGSVLRRSGAFDLLALGSRRQTAAELRIFGELACYVAGAVAFTSVAAWVATSRVAVIGGPDFFGLAARIAIATTFAALGYGLGRHAPRLMAIPVAVVVPYVLIGALLYFAPAPLGALSPLDDRFTPFSTDIILVPIVQTVLWTLLAVATIAQYAANRRVAFALAWGASALAGFLILTGNHDRAHDPEFAAPACVDDHKARVCLPLASSHLAEPLAQDINFVIDALPGLAPASASWIEEYVEWGAEPDEQWGTLQATAQADGYDVKWVAESVQVGVSTQVDHSQIRLALVQHLFAPWTIPGSFGEPSTNANEALLRWTIIDLELPSVGNDLYATLGSDDLSAPADEYTDQMSWFTSLTDDERAAFFRANSQAIRSGTLSWSSFGGRAR